MNTVSLRQPYQGVLQILEFNWRFYAITVACAAVTLCAVPFLAPLLRAAILLGLSPVLFWLAASLLVSHYVYDRYPLYDLSWIACALAQPPARWINIHCGLDETSTLLEQVFPHAAGEIVDIFDPLIMTEASIHRARHVTRQTGHCTLPETHAPHRALPFRAGSFNAAFCIFAAHELRRHKQRVELFSELARILAPDGELILMEHSRDWRNFLAFGPGFLHFFSPRAWRSAIAEAGFVVQREFSRTTFVRVYHLRRAL